MVYTIVYIYRIYHDMYHLPLLYIPWYIPQVVYTTFGVVYTMGQPSRWRTAVLPGTKHLRALRSVDCDPPGGRPPAESTLSTQAELDPTGPVGNHGGCTRLSPRLAASQAYAVLSGPSESPASGCPGRPRSPDPAALVRKSPWPPSLSLAAGT
jgi:hypothetical protein